MKKAVLLLYLVFPLGTAFSQQIHVPKNFALIEKISGDLDKDGINELVMAFDIQKVEKEVPNEVKEPTEENEAVFEGVPRELRIYKKKDKQWVLWQKSNQALFGSRDGGMMGDPFEEMKIENGVLLISQSGGSSWKWSQTDKYRYQDGEFLLIGYTSTAGKICEYWKNVDFNLLSGKMIVEMEYENCEEENTTQEAFKSENETLYKKGIKITLKERRAKEIKITTPKYKHEIYIATTE